jgi:hypothetical protein
LSYNPRKAEEATVAGVAWCSGNISLSRSVIGD